MEKITFIQFVKVIVLFCICTIFFLICLRILQGEYEHYHRYDTPEGPSIKVQRWKNE